MTSKRFNLSWVKFPAACCNKSELNPKNMILRGLPRRDFIPEKDLAPGATRLPAAGHH